MVFPADSAAPGAAKTRIRVGGGTQDRERPASGLHFRLNSPSGRLSNSVDILVLQLRDGHLLTESRTRFEEAAPPPDDRNAIRLIDGKLVFHFAIDALHGVNSSSRWKTVIPRRSQCFNPTNSELEFTHDLISAKDVYRPLGAPQSSMFDVLVRCQPGTDGDLACDAKALVHAGADHLYTSPTHVYWHSPDYIYAWDLNSLDVVTHRIRGTHGQEPKATLRNSTLHVALGRTACGVQR